LRIWLRGVGATCLSLLCLPFLSLVAPQVFAQSGGQVLYNGIVLPQQWPPSEGPTQSYQLPAYITSPPDPITIDLGRQLFVDDFLIQQTTTTRTQHQPLMYPGNPILDPAQSDTAANAFPYSDGVWFDPADQTYKMWYYCAAGNAVCYATSADGENWVKPSLSNAAVPYTNEVLVIDPSRDSATVWMDLQDPVTAHKYKAFVYNGSAIEVFFSPDGISWTQQSQYPVPVIYDRTTLFWNPFRNVWVDSLKNYLTLPPSGNRAGYITRLRYYAESPDLVHWTPSSLKNSFWTGPDVDDPPYVSGGMFPQLYNLDAVAYESLIVGLFSWYYPGPAYPSDDPNGLPGPALVELGVGFSRDGFQWVRPTRGSGPANAFIPSTDIPGTWNVGNTQSSGGGFLVVGDELWFYFSGRNGPHGVSTQGSTGLATLRRDGFYSMDAGAAQAVLTTRAVQFTGKYLFVNVDDPTGQLLVEVTDTNGNVIAPFSATNCVPIGTNKTLQQVTWNGATDLSGLAGKSVQFTFYLTSGSLYSFWVTSSAAGASNGYVAGNGPGFIGMTDTLGSAAYPSFSVTPGSALLNQSQSQQFTAAVSLQPGSNQSVAWTISPNIGSITQAGVYTAPALISGNPTVTVTATSQADSTKSGSAAISLATRAVATFVTSDTATEGNWQGVYGADGYSIANSSQSVPGYVVLNTESQPLHTWSPAPTDPRALLTGIGSARIASTWFNYPTAAFDLNFTDGNSHLLALYFLDWDNNGRVETVQVRDATTNGLLDSRAISDFTNGIYLTWAVAGHITVNVTLVSGPNAVLSAFFFGGATAGAGGGGSGGGGGGSPPITVTVSPQTISLAANQSQPFTATVQNASTTSVVWSISPNVGGISQTGVYTAPPSVTSPQAVTVKALSNADSATFGTANVNLTAGAVANFVGTDSNTQGTWQHVYGNDGYSVANNSQSIPGYASFTTVGAALYTWNPATTDARALEEGVGSGRIASTWYGYPSFTLAINLSDGNSHQLSLYALDWDNQGRSETITLQNATTNAVLNTQTISKFSGGIYLIWNVTGSVKITVTLISGPNAVISGVFFDPVGTTSGGSGSGGGGGSGPVTVSVTPKTVGLGANQSQTFTATVQNSTNQNVTWSISPNVGSINSSTGAYKAPSTISSAQPVTVTATSASGPFGTATVNLTAGAVANFVTLDTATQGTWRGTYGADGHFIAQDSTTVPSYAAFSISGDSLFTWAPTTTDPRALENGANTGRLAACAFTYSSLTFDVNFTDGNAHPFELYALDWDSKGRSEAIQIVDANSNAVLDNRSISSFANGVYLVWNISGHVRITVTLSAGPNAVISGAFFN
jgi:hypothetical protein